MKIKISSKFSISFDEMMDKITNDNEPIDYEKLMKEPEIARKDSMSFTKRRSFILTNKEQLPKFILSNFLVNY